MATDNPNFQLGDPYTGPAVTGLGKVINMDDGTFVEGGVRYVWTGVGDNFAPEGGWGPTTTGQASSDAFYTPGGTNNPIDPVDGEPQFIQGRRYDGSPIPGGWIANPNYYVMPVKPSDADSAPDDAQGNSKYVTRTDARGNTVWDLNPNYNSGKQPDSNKGSGTSVDVNPAALRQTLIGLFPWAKDWYDDILGWVQDGFESDGIIANIRADKKYGQMFPGILRDDGTMRFANEAQYLKTVDDYRQTLIDFGFHDPTTESPQDYAALMRAGVDVNELSDRLGTYRELETGSQELRDAFYVYGGIDVTVDDLFAAVVDPTKKKALEDAYNEATIGGVTDYETFIQRASTVGVERITKRLGELQATGEIDDATVSKVLRMDPMFAQNLMGAIFQNPGGNGFLGLEEMESAFEYAVLGSAATEAGFAMPDVETLEKFIAQGIDGARLRGAYNTLGQRSSALQGMMARATQSPGVSVSQVQSAFEGSLLGESSELRYAQAAESALGQAGGGFAAQRAGNRLAQPGRSVY